MYESCFLQTTFLKMFHVPFDQKTRSSICFKTCDRTFETLTRSFETLDQAFETLCRAFEGLREN